MKVQIMSKPVITKLIENGKFPKNTCVLSFYGEYQEEVKFPSSIRHLTLCIDDLRTQWEVSDPYSFHNDDFKKAAKFVLDSNNFGLDIIVQCEAGYSRSAGSAMAITEFFNKDGIKIFTDYTYSPNPIFFNQLFKYLKEEDKKRKEKEKC